MSSNVKLINLDSGDIMDCDLYKLMKKGIPEGYKPVEDIAQNDWANMYSKLRKEAGIVNRTLGVIIDEITEIIEDNSPLSEGLDVLMFDLVDDIGDEFRIGDHMWKEDILPDIADKYSIETDSLIDILDYNISLGELVMKTATIISSLLKKDECEG